MDQTLFERAIDFFDIEETMRSRVYYSALRLIDAGFIVEAHILLLATWNSARFRYVVTTFNLPEYETLIRQLGRELQPLSKAEFATVELRCHRNLIIDSFNKVAAIRGIESTGASKILHLMNPMVFVMWDGAIAGHYQNRAAYEMLEIRQSGFWNPSQWPFARNGDGYYEFMIFCQTRFKGLESPTPTKTFAKCVDEFNYCAITKCLPSLNKPPSRGRRSSAV